jgi:hypothetical protein
MSVNDAELQEFALSDEDLAHVAGGEMVVMATRHNPDGSSGGHKPILLSDLAKFKERQETKGTLGQWSFSEPYEAQRGGAKR